MKGEINEGYELENNSKVINIGSNDIENLNTLKNHETASHYDNNKKKNYLKEQFKNNKKIIKNIIKLLTHVLVGVYFGIATNYYVKSESGEILPKDRDDTRCRGKCGLQWCNGYGMFLLCIIFVYFGLFYYLIFKPTIGKRIHRQYLKPLAKFVSALFKSRIILTVTSLLIIIAIGIFLFFETRGDERRLIALLTPIFFIIAGYVFSTDRNAIKWKTVLIGLLCQFLLGIICLRSEIGRDVFQCLGDKIVTFLNYSQTGARFVFGDRMVDEKVFAFGILPVIYFFSFCISILYYLGVMQWILLRLGWILQTALNTTVCESVNGAANIFLGMSESPLLIRPYINKLTNSEMHAIMTSGFATVSGTVLAAYVSFGASPALLVSSSVMAAPAALAISKLYYPESEESQTKSNNIKLEESEDTSILDAASNGAQTGTVIILGIFANLVAFVAFIAFLNGFINWFGYLVGLDEINFEWLFSKLFVPLSWMIGIEWKDCQHVAEIIAAKSIVNEFVAYEKLGKYLNENLINMRSAATTTFAICGFANPSSLGIMIGSLSALAPSRRLTITTVALRAFWVGSIVCFISASFATLLMPQSMIDDLAKNNTEKTIRSTMLGPLT